MRKSSRKETDGYKQLLSNKKTKQKKQTIFTVFRFEEYIYIFLLQILKK